MDGTGLPPDTATATPATTPEESEAVSTATVRLVQGSTLVICDASGDITGQSAEGLFVGDCRICSGLIVNVDDLPVEPLSFVERSPFAASFVGRTADHGLALFRHLWVGRGMRLDLGLRNDPTPLSVPSARQQRWVERLPRLHTDVRGLGPAFDRAGQDIGGLQPDIPEASSTSTRSFPPTPGASGSSTCPPDRSPTGSRSCAAPLRAR